VPKASILTYHAYYLSAEGGGGDGLNATRRHAGEWETFNMVDLNGGYLQSGDEVAFQTQTRHYVSAQNEQLTADSSARGYWETFTIVRADGSRGLISYEDKIGLRAANGRYVSAKGGGGSDVFAISDWLGLNETFTYTLRKVVVPRVTEYLVGQAIEEIEAAGLVAQTWGDCSGGNLTTGAWIQYQDPRGGTLVPLESTVDLTCSSDPPP
jgi:hypothetical protein